MNAKNSISRNLRRRLAAPCVLACVGFWLACGPASAAENSNSKEYQVKAAYLYHFTEFINWPTNILTAPEAPIVIGILGEDPFGVMLDELVSNAVVRGHPLVIKRLKPGDDLQNCQMLYISHDAQAQMPALLQKLKGSAVLTVGDSSGFAEQGGMVNFVIVEEKKVVDDKTIVQEKVKLEINPEAAEQAGLQISSKLLKLARIVKNN